MLCLLLVLAVTDVHTRAVRQGYIGPRTFQPAFENVYKIFGASGEVLAGDRFKAGVEFFANDIMMIPTQVKVSSSHTSKHNGVTHIYVQQIQNGVPIANGYGNINILSNGQVHSLGSSFRNVSTSETSNLLPKHSASDAVKALASLLNIETPSNLGELSMKKSRIQPTLVTGDTFTVRSKVKSELNYLHTNDGCRLVRKITVDMSDNYYVAYVDTDSNKVLSLIDYVAHASYNVIPYTQNDPRQGGLRLVENPEDTELASPYGWHQSGPAEKHTNTIGNNIIAQQNLVGGDAFLNKPRPDGQIVGDTLVFRYNIANFSEFPTAYTNASTVQLFYMTNIMHDLSYRYGFTEDAGNFQKYNFDRGGNGNDAVIANTQDRDIAQGADFRTDIDGTNGRIRMGISSVVGKGSVDGSYDASVVVHEYHHGISTRLTGGRMNAQCLPYGESQGMGEGWSDMFAVMFLSNESSNRNKSVHMYTYFELTDPETGPGVRKYPYTTDMTVNPSTYAHTIQPDITIHDKGAVWTAILNEGYWNLVEKHGFQKDWYKTKASEAAGGKLGGNVIFAQLLVDGMKLQPCHPTFIQARDAIIEADWINNNWNNFDELWTGFAKRGLGNGARSPGVEEFTKPVKPDRPAPPPPPLPPPPLPVPPGSQNGNQSASGGVPMSFIGFTLSAIRFLLTFKAV